MPPTTSQAFPQPVRAWEVIEWLRERLDVPEELGEAFLAVWVWAIRYAALSIVGQEERFLDQPRDKAAKMLFSAGLAPQGWRDEDLRAQITLQTGLPDDTSRQLFEELATKLRVIDGRLFEPLGWFSSRNDNQPGFTLLFNSDFLEPALDEPPDLGIESTPKGVVLNGELPLGGCVPRRFDWEVRFSEARGLLASNGAELVSLKVRPLQKWPVYAEGDFQNGCVYTADYQTVEPLLSSRFRRLREGWIEGGEAAVYAPEDKFSFVFVKHETGPEIIAPVNDLASLALAEPVVEIIQATLRAVDRSNRACEESGNKSGRHYHVEAVSLEDRREEGARILAVFLLPLSEESLVVLLPLLESLRGTLSARER